MDMAEGTAPGKSHRKGITLRQIIRRYPTEASAENWFIKQRWPKGVCCPYCGSLNVQAGAQHKTMPFRCREKACGRKRFSVRTRSVMECSKVRYQDWLLALFLVSTSLKGQSSMKLHRDLGVTQKTAWFLAHRIRMALSQASAVSHDGPVEVDETCAGGKRKNMPKARREQLAGRGPVGKTAVVGARDRETNQVAAEVVTSTDKQTLQGFVREHAAHGATVCTDDAGACETLPCGHDSVKHSLQEHVKGDVHTSGIESLWSLSSAPTRAHSTSCRQSTWSAACRSSPGATTCAGRTRLG